MDELDNQKMAELMQREFDKLPDRQAPRTLLPRVLTVIQMRSKPWWRRPWLMWPGPVRLISLAFALVVLASVYWGGMAAWRGVGEAGVFGALEEGLQPLVTFWELMLTLGNALLLALGSISRVWCIAVGVVLFAMYVSCLGVGTLCYRFVLKPYVK